MQEKVQKNSPIKKRILQFAENLGISKREFYAKIDVSRGTLESKTGITEDIICRFLIAFPDVNIEWLITGKGDAYKTNDFATQPQAQSTDTLSLVNHIKEQAEEIGRLKERLATYEREKEKTALDALNSGTARAV